MTLRRFVIAAIGALALAAGGQAARAAPDDMGLGDPKAKVTVIEYASVSCPHCAHWNAEVFPAFKARYVDTGKVRYVLREMPIHGPIDAAGFLIARCAGPKYFEAVDALMADQKALFESQDARGWLLRAAAKVGVEEKQAQTCVEDKAAQAAFDARYEANMKEFKVDSTPTLFVNGERVADGELATLDKAIQAHLTPAKPKAKPRPKSKARKR